MVEQKYFISEAAKMVGVENHVLRYWEEELGIEVERDSQGKRCYSSEDIALLQKVKVWKDRGLQLKAVKELLPQLKKRVTEEAEKAWSKEQEERDWQKRSETGAYDGEEERGKRNEASICDEAEQVKQNEAGVCDEVKRAIGNKTGVCGETKHAIGNKTGVCSEPEWAMQRKTGVCDEAEQVLRNAPKVCEEQEREDRNAYGGNCESGRDIDVENCKNSENMEQDAIEFQLVTVEDDSDSMQKFEQLLDDILQRALEKNNEKLIEEICSRVMEELELQMTYRESAATSPAAREHGQRNDRKRAGWWKRLCGWLRTLEK